MFQFENVIGIIVADKDGIVKSVSCENGNLTSNLIGNKWYDALPIPREEYNKTDDKYPKIFGIPEIGQKILVHPSYGKKGDVSGFHILIEKIDDDKNSTQYLNKMLCFGKIVPGIAHEIRNPLTYVSGWLQMFLSEADDNDPKKRTYETLIKEFERISKLVSTLLEFAKQSPTSKKIFGVNQVIEDVVLMVEYTMRNENIEIIKNLLCSELKVDGDDNKFKQVFLNLLQNARESMQNGGKIYLSTNHIQNNSVIIQCRDTGCGIAVNEISKIFRPFYTTKANDNGTGLGLSVCKAIIEKASGTIDIDSKVGKGTIVTIILPICSSD